MKVVIIGDNSSVHIQKWISAIAEYKEVELHVIAFDLSVKFNKVKYYQLNNITGTKMDYLLNAFKVKSYIKKIKPDLIHAHYATSYGFLAGFSGFHPLIITGWGADIFDSPKNPLMKRMLANSFKKADAISVLSEITRNEMKKLTNKFVHLIPFGVDTEKFFPKKYKSDAIIKIGTIRTLSEKYGVEYLIRAFAEVCKIHQNIQLEIVGDGPLRLFLENLTVKLGVEKKVVFYGYINQNLSFEQYITILRSLDIFAILSILDSETFGVSAVEASACGIPVVATSVGGLPEVIESEKTGIIVPPKNVEATAKALNRLISDEQLRIKMGKNGRKKVEEKYNWSTNISQMINLYSQTIEKSRKYFKK
jgi:glycosyltransferase involved in cell wall biosynthesis